jgi:hypothetical protein
MIMDTSSHTMEGLFVQLGLDSREEAINEFIRAHHLSGTGELDEASFWTPAQARFIREAWEDDADWAEVVDQLDVLLRN